MPTSVAFRSLMPALYSHRLADIQDVAAAAGYAIAVHGSMQRDLDLIAVPWVDDAEPASVLLTRLCAELGLTATTDNPTERPHGRWAWTLLMGGACFMDLSVMGRQTRVGASGKNLETEDA